MTPNVVDGWLALLHIREDPGWNLGPETGYPDWGLSCFPSVPPGEFWDSTLKLGFDRFLPNPFQFTIRLSPFHSTQNSQLLKSRWKIIYKLIN
jgi:hypothetical protein